MNIMRYTCEQNQRDAGRLHGLALCVGIDLLSGAKNGELAISSHSALAEGRIERRENMSLWELGSLQLTLFDRRAAARAAASGGTGVRDASAP